MPCIYKITNLVNDKFYIGSTIRKRYIRKYEHLRELRANTHCNKHLQHSFNKYGEQNFKFEVIEELMFPKHYSKQLILDHTICREIYLINLLKADYNIKKDDEQGRSEYKHSEETKRKISESNLKRFEGKELAKSTIIARDREKRRLEGKLYKVKGVRKNIPSGNPSGSKKGWKHSKEAIEKIRKRSSAIDNIERMKVLQRKNANNRIGTHWSDEIKINSMVTKFGVRRIIEIFDKEGKFVAECNFSKEAADITKAKKSAVRNVLCKYALTANGYSFKYKEIQ